jgi:predicted nuclease of predicted toxin-antitoxin system
LTRTCRPELVDALVDAYPDSQHVHDRGLGASDDRDVWEYAKSFRFVIVTKYADFYERSMRVGAPPKVIWVRLGNCTTAAVEMLLRNSKQALTRFACNEESYFVLGRR